jgi:hypothetical protein
VAAYGSFQVLSSILAIRGDTGSYGYGGKE